MAPTRTPAPPRVAAALLPMVALVFVDFLVIGLAMTILPLHVHRDLGLGTLAVRYAATCPSSLTACGGARSSPARSSTWSYLAERRRSTVR